MGVGEIKFSSCFLEFSQGGTKSSDRKFQTNPKRDIPTHSKSFWEEFPRIKKNWEREFSTSPPPHFKDLDAIPEKQMEDSILIQTTLDPRSQFENSREKERKV
jgi:hypothetical protein